MPRQSLRAAALALAVLGAPACGGYAVLDVSGLPDDEAFDHLLVRATVGAREAEPATFRGVDGPSLQLGLRTPLDLPGQVVVSVEAWNDRGCRVARGRGDADGVARALSIPVSVSPFVAESCPADGWLWEAPLPFGYNLRAVLDLGTGSSAESVWAAGQDGVVLRHDGRRFRKLPVLDDAGSPLPPLQIEALGGLDPGRVFAGGEDGLLLRCDEGGCRQLRRGGAFITSVAAVPGGVVAVTDDGDVLSGSESGGAYAFATYRSAQPLSFRAVAAGAQAVYAVGAGGRAVVVRCKDRACEERGLPLPVEPMLFRRADLDGVAFADGKIWVAGKITHGLGCKGMLYWAAEGQTLSWQMREVPDRCDVGPLAAAGADLFLLTPGEVQRVPLSAPTDLRQTLAVPGFLTGLSASLAGGLRLWVSGHQGTLRRFSGSGLLPGTGLSGDALGDEGQDVVDLFGASSHDVLALLGPRAGAGPASLFRFQGTRWGRVDLPAIPGDATLRRLSGAGSTVWAVGDRCTVLQRKDGNWRRIAHGPLSEVCRDVPDLRALWVGDSGDPWVVGSGGGVYRIGESGAARVPSPPSKAALTAVSGRGGEVFAVSEDGAILRCGEGGCAAERGADGKVLLDVWAQPAGPDGAAGAVYAVAAGGQVLQRGPAGAWIEMGNDIPDLKGLPRLRVSGAAPGPDGAAGEVWIAGGGVGDDFSAVVARLSGGRWLVERGVNGRYPIYALWLDRGGQPWVAGWGGTVQRRAP